MEKNEIMKAFERLYNKMVMSKEPKYMNIFGGVMECMMKDIADWRPDAAQEYINRLEAINWYNYLSKKEAAQIVGSMEPNGGWSTSEWESCMKSQGICLEEEPYYNKWALYTAMNMVYSDSIKTIAKIAGKSLTEMSQEEIFNAVHLLALDKLKDKDGVFNVRKYFGV